jgi:uncharacterized membrane protein
MNHPSRALSAAATVAAAAASALAYPFLPQRVATHFDADGQPDHYDSRFGAAVKVPAVMAGLLVLNDRLGGWPGRRDREDEASGADAREQMIGLSELVLLANHVAVLGKGLGALVDMGRVSRAVLGTFLVALGNLMPRLPRNGLVGIRTPWTMADPRVWERTHRLGGYLCMAAGLLTVASLPSRSKWAARLPLVALLSALGLSAAYSYVVFARHSHSDR